MSNVTDEYLELLDTVETLKESILTLIKERDEWREAAEFNYQQYNDLMALVTKQENK